MAGLHTGSKNRGKKTFACALSGIVLALASSAAHAHGGSHAQPGSADRARIGASALTPSGEPEDWGTYCVTELTPIFREAIALNRERDAQVRAQALSLSLVSTDQQSRVPGKPLLPALPALNSTPVSGDKGKITVYTARKIVTMDPGWPEATAVAVHQGRVVSVGTLDDLEPWLRRYPYEVDERFADKVIYPGFVEPHTHLVMGSVAVSLPPLTYYPLRNPYGPDFPGVKTLAEAVAQLKKYVANAKTSDETIMTWGYDVVAMGGRELPTKDDLDGISKTHPIVVWDASEHYAFLNSAALAKFGVSNDVLAKTVGAGRLADGSSNGQFLGTEAAKLVMPKALAERLTPEVGVQSMHYLGALMQQAGVTTMGDLFYGGVDLQMEDALVNKVYGTENGLARVVHVADGATFKKLFGEGALEKALELRAKSTDRIMYNGVKFFADDAFLPFAMEMQWPGYTDSERYKGLFMYSTTDAFIDDMRPWWNAGFQIHVHSNGSGGNQITLDALAALQAERPRFDHRFTFEHFGISSTAQGRQLKALGALVSTQPYYVYQRADLSADAIGTDRASLASRMSSLMDQDIVVGLHSDTPVGIPSPLLQVWIAVQRIGAKSGKVHAPAERVQDVYRAMRMVTTDAAYLLGIDDRVGSIESGKMADFVVLADDPQEVDPMKIRDIEVVATILGGKATLTADTRKPPAH